MGYASTFFRQTGSLLSRNFLLKRRVKRQIIIEFLFPFFFVIVLGLIRIGMKSSDKKPVIPSFSSFALNNRSLLATIARSGTTIYVSPESSAVTSVMDAALTSFGGMFTYKQFSSASASESAYRSNNTGILLGIDFADGTLNNPSYTIRSGFNLLLNGATFAINQGYCRDNSTMNSLRDCPASYYLTQGVALFQVLIDTALIQFKSGSQTTVLLQNVSAQMMPKDSFQPPSLALQNIASLWFVFTFFPFVLFLVMLLVGEKEKKIKEGMRMMGMKDGAYWFAWALCYAVIILAVCIVITIVVAILKILMYSNLGLFLLLIFLYGLTLITISFMMTPFFDRSQIAGAVASMATIVFSFLYLAISLTRYSLTPDGYLSTIPSSGQWLLALFSPVALALSIDQIFFLDINRGGLSMSTISTGQFTVQAGLIMLSIDIVLYALLALYFDNVIPTEYGPRQSAWFCFLPSYWRGSKRSDHVDLSETEQTADNIEAMPADMKSKKVISIANITKQFKVNGKTVNAVNGISLDIYEGQITALLGHNGAGKTTLISMLTGLTSPTSGTANIYNLDIRNTTDLSELRSIFGVCPQHDILFPLLSPFEHLQFFAAMKGVPRKDITNEVATVLANCDLSLQRDTPSEKLSGGQKRKLSVAIALIGAPKIVLLDEPTAGMDPVSRRHLWNLLKKSRANRVIILTTHFMDEADILADRKAIVSKGRVKCVGSSLFLKNRFGLGYHLGLETTNDAVVADVTDVVRSHVPNASMARVHGHEMTFILPLANVGQFAALFATLEKLKEKNSKGIAGFGIAMTTLEEVFLQIGEEEVEDEDAENNGFKVNNGQVAIELEPQKIEKNGHPLSAESYENLFKQEFIGDLLYRQFGALMKVRLLLMGRSKKAIFCRLVLPLLLTLAGALVQKYVTVSASNIAPIPTNLATFQYARITSNSKSEKQPNFYLGDASATGNSVSNFKSKLTSNGLVTEALPDNITYIIDAFPHYVGIDLFRVDLTQPQLQTVQYTALYNDSAFASLPVIINTASNVVLSLLAPSSQLINVTSLMWPSLSVSGIALGGSLTTALLMGLAIAIIPPFFGVAVVKDKEAKARSQLRIAGISGVLYWGTTYLLDLIQYFVTCFLLLIILVAVGGTTTINGPAALCYIIMFIIFVPNLLTFVYLLSFAFSTADNTQTVLTSGFVLGSFLPFLVVSILSASVSASAASAFHQVVIFLDPPYGVIGLLYCMQNASLTITAKNSSAEVGVSDYFAWNTNIPITYISGAIHLAIFAFLLYTVEAAQTDHGPVGWYHRSRQGRERRRALPMETQSTEDSDVALERKKIEQIANGSHSASGKMPVVVVRSLYKEFEKFVSGGCCGCNCSPGLVKVAVANNSFTVNVGEVFGLLGPNGAGKTTTMNMIIAEETPTGGEVLLQGQDLHRHTESALSSLGYCPQHNPLWDELTLQEHLEIYATIRGVPEANIPAAVSYFLDALKLNEHAKKYSTNLSGGTKRKLCYCISLLGAPRVVLLDEPSTGMDPKSKRFLWDTISATFRSDKRGAILTTHYMEEANALCSRIGIMINGRMECLGSAQHLKNKYGSGYTLEVKLAPTNQNTGQSNQDKLNAYINSVIPGVRAVEIFGDRITYSVPTDNMAALSEIFTKLEQGKSVVGIEEYSFSQATLEQVFLSFAKKQLSEEEQAARDRLALGQDNSGAEVDTL